MSAQASARSRIHTFLMAEDSLPVEALPAAARTLAQVRKERDALMRAVQSLEERITALQREADERDARREAKRQDRGGRRQQTIEAKEERQRVVDHDLSAWIAERCTVGSRASGGGQSSRS